MRLLLLQWITKNVDSSLLLPILSEHCADEDAEVRLYCITSLAQYPRKELKQEMGREGIIQICRNLARAPFPSLGSVGTAFLIHTVREEIETEVKKKGITISTAPAEQFLDLISSSKVTLAYSAVVIMSISQGMNWTFWKPFIRTHLPSLLTTDCMFHVCKKHILIAL